MTQATDTDIKELKDLIQQLDRKIDLGFANVDTKLAEIKQVEAKLEGKIDNLNSKQRQRGRNLCLSEVMTILVAFHQQQYRNFKYYYLNHVSVNVLCGLIAYCHQPKKPSLQFDWVLPASAQPHLQLGYSNLLIPN